MIRRAIINDIPTIQIIIHHYMQDFIVNSEGE